MITVLYISDLVFKVIENQENGESSELVVLKIFEKHPISYLTS